jgi:hypothetical protein
MEGADPSKIERESISDAEAMGITPRGVKELFQQIEDLKERDRTKHISVFCSYLQIYNEKVFDLLNPASVGGVAALRKTQTNQFQKDQ